MTDIDTEFGDIERDDLWDNEPPATEQVTYRIHESRRYFVLLDEDEIADFFDLPEQDQEVAFAIGEAVVDWILEHRLSEAAQLSEHLHDIQRYFAPDRIPEWDSLTEEERVVGASIVAHLADWLGGEGSWR